MKISLAVRKTLMHSNLHESRLFNVLLEPVERKTRLYVMILLRKTFELIICSGLFVRLSSDSTLYCGGFYYVWIFLYVAYETVRPALLRNSSDDARIIAVNTS